MAQGKFKGKPKGPWTPKKVKDQDGNDVLDLPCHIHTKKDEVGNFIYPEHTTRQCRLLIQQFREKQPSDKEKGSDKEEDDDGFPNANSTLMIFADVESKSRLKVINREDVGGNDTYGITRIPTVVSGARGRERSRSNR